MVTKVPEVLEFFDVGKKKRFRTSKFRITTVKGKGGRRKAAVAKSPFGDYEVFKFLPK